MARLKAQPGDVARRPGSTPSAAADAIRMNRSARVSYASVLSRPLDQARFETLLVKARLNSVSHPLNTSSRVLRLVQTHASLLPRTWRGTFRQVPS
jgi:hypothetical protein